MADDYQANIRAKRNGKYWTPPDNLSAVSHDYNTEIAGEALTITEVCYQASTGKWLDAQADSEIEAKSRLGMAMSSPDADTDKFIVLFEGYVKNTTWAFTMGLPVFLSPTVAGGLTQTLPTTGNFVRVLGFPAATNVLHLRPSNDYGEV